MRIATAAVLTFLVSVGCKSKVPDAAHPAHADDHHDEKAHDALPRQVRASAEVVAQAGIRTDVVNRKVLATTVTLPGEVVAVPDRTARLSTAAAGTLAQVSFNEGATVAKGQSLALLRVPDVGRLRGAHAAATARARAAKTNASRLRSLRDTGLGADQAVLDAEAEAHAQESEAHALGEQLGALGVNADDRGGYLVPLRAPLAGVVVARDAVVGQPVSADHVLANIVDLSEVWFLGRVFEKDLERLRVGAPCEVRLNAFPKEPFAGVVDYIGQQTDPLARTLTARIRLKNEGARARLGLFGSAHVEVAHEGESALKLVVPQSAVTEVGDKSVVFVRAQDGDFVVHEVTLGDAALGLVQVLSGLEEGEVVAVSGVFTLKSLLLKSTLAEDEH